MIPFQRKIRKEIQFHSKELFLKISSLIEIGLVEQFFQAIHLNYRA
jgi:hypothetical protein